MRLIDIAFLNRFEQFADTANDHKSGEVYPDRSIKVLSSGRKDLEHNLDKFIRLQELFT